jgi:hypothetical protein
MLKLGMIVDCARRLDVVIETAVLVVGNHQQRLLPAGTRAKGVVDRGDQFLPGDYV